MLRRVTYIAGFTGVDQEYEKPETPDLVVKTVDCTVEESMLQVVEMLEEHVSATT
jgi:3'-phosphoadenosine 5'-phosphosulfate synthase